MVFLSTNVQPRSDASPSHRSSDPTLRRKYVRLVEDVRQHGGEVLVFSSMHESGQRKHGRTRCSGMWLTPHFVRIKPTHRRGGHPEFPA